MIRAALWFLRDLVAVMAAAFQADNTVRLLDWSRRIRSKDHDQE